MTVRKVIHDSDDDEEDDDVEDMVRPRISRNLENSTPFFPELSVDPSMMRSAELLDRQIRDAQCGLMGSSSFTQLEGPYVGGIGRSDGISQSSAMSKVNRRQSTVGEATSEKKKVLKTYRSKTTVGNLGLHAIDVQEGGDITRTKKRRLNNDEPVRIGAPLSLRASAEDPAASSYNRTDETSTTAHEEIELDTPGHAKNLFESNSVRSSVKDYPLKKNTNRKSFPFETSSSSSWDTAKDVVHVQDQPTSRGTIINIPLSEAQQIYDEPRACTSSQITMFPPPVKTANSTQPEYHYSEASTIVNTPVDLVRSSNTHKGSYMDMEAASPIQMVTSSVSVKSKSGQEEHSIISDARGGTGKGSVSKIHDLKPSSLVNDEVATNKFPLADPEVSSSCIKTGKDINDLDELSLPKGKPTKPSDPGSVSKNTSKRKSINDDESSSDSASIGLPKEQYQPRPSRSRSNRAVDDLVVPIDYSKRPEAFLKGKRKAKRSKTTGDDPIDLEASMGSIGDKVAQKILVDKIGTMETKLQDVVSSNILSVEVPMHNLLVPNQDVEDKLAIESVEPKKKRGRPKKQVLTDVEDRIPETTTSEPVLPSMSILDDEELELPLPTKKPWKRRETKEALLPASTESMTKDIPPQLQSGEPGRRGLQDKPAIILANMPSKANITKQPHVVVESISELERSAKEGFPKGFPDISTTHLPHPLVQTPQKPNEKPKETEMEKAGGSKGPDKHKHSPLLQSSGKLLRHRVGLSKKANIAPLLKVMKK